MSDPTQNPTGDPNPNPSGDPTPAAPPASAPPADSVVLSKSEYSQMVAQMAQMQAVLEMVQGQQPQGQSSQAQTQTTLDPNDIDRLSNSQMLQMINQQIQQATQPMLQSIMTLAIKEELRGVESKYSDFSEFKDEVYKLAQANTHLSLEQAYLLAKSGKTPPPAPKQDPKPATPATPAPTPSERPGVTPSAVQTTRKQTIEEAAAAALKELQYQG